MADTGRASLREEGKRRVRMPLSGGHMDICLSPDATPETVAALRELGQAAVNHLRKREAHVPVLLKNETVLDIVYATNESACFQPSSTDEEYPRPMVILPFATYDDLGEPQTITVTIEAGDKLNA